MNMRTRFSFGKSVIICVISFFAISAAFTGCGTDYDDDIDYLGSRIDSLKTALSTLEATVNSIKSKVDAGKMIQNVTQYSDGSRTGIQINYVGGGSDVVYNGTNGQDGSAGTPGRIFVIKDSLWHYIGPTGLDTIKYISDQYPNGIRAIPRDGEDGSLVKAPEVKDNFWIFFTWNGNTQQFDTTKTNMPSGDVLSYIVDPGAPSPYELYIRTMDANGNLTALRQKIELPRVGTVNTGFDFLGYAKVSNDPEVKFSVGSINSSADLTMYYWYLSSTVNWSDGQKEVERRQVLTSLRGDSIYLVVNTSLSFENTGQLYLENSEGETLPIQLGEPIKVTGLLTKVSSDPLYIIPLSAIDETYTNATAVRNDYLSLFKEDAIYRITNGNGSLKSNFSSFTIKPEDGPLSFTSPIVTRIGNNIVNTNGSGDKAVEIRRGQGHKLYFSDSKFLYDYKVEKVGNSGSLDYDNANGILTVSGTADVTIKVSKLYVNGSTDSEEIEISTRTTN